MAWYFVAPLTERNTTAQTSAMEASVVVIDAETLPQLAEQLAEVVVKRLSDEAQRSPWMNLDQLVAHVGWSRTKLQRLTAAREIPCHPHGNLILYRRDEIDAWLSSLREGPEVA